MKLKYHILALVTVAIWGVTFVSTKMLIGAGMGPAEIFFCRFAIAYVGIWLLSLPNGKDRRLLSDSLKDELLLLVLGVTGGSVYFLAENNALRFSQACNVSFIVCIAPLLTLLLHSAVINVGNGRFSKGQEKVRMGAGLIVGTVLALCGMAMVIFSETRLQISPKGDFLAFCAALCWAVYSIVMGTVSEKYSSVFITRKIFFYGLVTILPFLSAAELIPAGALERVDVVLNLLFLSIAASLIGFVAWNKAMAGLGNVTSTNYIYLNPFFTLIAAMILLGESLTPLQAAGSASIVTGVILACGKKQHIE